MSPTFDGGSRDQPRLSDEELLRRVGAGDDSAYDALHHEYYPRLCRYFGSMHRLGQADLEDLASDVMEVVLRGAQGFRGESSVEAWVFGIASNKARTEFRTRRSRRTDTTVDVTTIALRDPGAGPESHAHTAHLRDRMLEAYRRLPDIHREVLDLVYRHGLTMDAIAALLEIPSGTVKRRAQIARQKLKAILLEAGVAPDDVG